MGSIPLPALATQSNTQSPLDLYAKIQGIRELQQRQQIEQQQSAQQKALYPGQIQAQTQQNQSGALDLQQKQIQLDDQKKLMKIYSNHASGGSASSDATDQTVPRSSPKVDLQGNLGSMVQDAMDSGVSPTGINTLVKAASDQADLANKILTTGKDQRDAIVAKNEALWKGAETIRQIPEGSPERAQAYQSLLPNLQQQGIDVSKFPQQAPTNAQLDAIEAPLGQINGAIELASKKADLAKKQAEAPGGSQAPVEPAELAEYIKTHPNSKTPAQDFAKWKASLTPQAQINVQAGLLTPQAKDMAAENYFQTGQLPAGMRSPGAISSIINRAGELHPGENLSGNKAAFEANKKSYDNVTGTLDTLSAFEQSGLKNLKQFTDLADKLPDTGVPWLTTPVRKLDANVVGAKYLPAIEAARSVALREIARVTNDPKLSGSLTDSARQEVSSFSPENATLPQIKEVVHVLQNDMANVHSSLAAQKADIGTRLGIKAGATNAGGSQGGGQSSNAAPPANDPFAQFGGKLHQ